MWTITVLDAQGRAHSSCQIEQGALVLGRADGNDLVVEDPTVSRQHARLEVREGALWVADLGSSNGVLVDGRPIAAPTAISQQSQVQVSTYTLKIAAAAEGPDPLNSTLVMDKRPVPVSPAVAPVTPRPVVSAPAHPVRREVRQAPKVSRAPVSDANETTATSELDQKIDRIRSHREQVRNQSQSKRDQFDEEWQALIEEMRALRGRLRTDSRVLYLTISRDEREITTKIERDPGGTRHMYMIMTRGHPDGRKLAGDERIWLRDPTRDDVTFTEPAEALSDFLSRVAGALA